MFLIILNYKIDMNKNLPIFVLFLAICFPLFSQHYSNIIHGKIIDVDKNTTVIGASLQLRFNSEVYTAKTDSTGNYSITTSVRYLDGKYEINITHPDYYELNGVVFIKELSEHNFGLKHKREVVQTIDTIVQPLSKLEGFASNNWTLLVDMSSSMGENNILPIMKSGLNDIVDYFRSEDKITLLTFSTGINEILPPTYGNNKDKIHNAIASLIKVGGTTNGASAIKSAFQKASENYIINGNNRILIFTDGMFTSGAKEYKNFEKTLADYAQKNINCSIFLLGNPTDYVIKQLKFLAIAGKGTFAVLKDETAAKQMMLDEAKLVRK